jgi:recombination protein RecR
MPDTLTKLAELFNRFPGIGPRQARRFVYFLLAAPRSFREELARGILELSKIIHTCTECQRFFSPARGATLCPLCADPTRDRSTLMVVEKDVDLENVEKSRGFTGTYFILGGTVPILEKNPEERIHLKKLEGLIAHRAKEGLTEVVLALSLTTEGESTEEFLKEHLTPLAEKYGFKISTLGRGLSTGLELEYSDPETIKNALKNRQ